MQKSGGGGGGNRRAPQNDHGDRYSQPSYNQGGQQSQSQPPAAGAPDPYAAYVSTILKQSILFSNISKGGYEAYVALWYQAMAAQQQQAGGAPGDASKPPGTS